MGTKSTKNFRKYSVSLMFDNIENKEKSNYTEQYPFEL